MREEYPSNTTTAGSDSGDEDEEKPDVAIDVDQPAGREVTPLL